MLSWIRKRAGSPYIKALMIVVALTFFGGFGLLSSTSFQSCLGIEMQDTQQGSVLATVGEDKIMESDYKFAYSLRYNMLYSRLRQQFPNQPNPEYMIDEKSLRQDVIEKMAREKLVADKARELGLEVSDTEVQEAIASAFRDPGTGQFDRDSYRRVLMNMGASSDYYENFVKEQMLFQKYLDIIAAGVDVTPQEVRERYAFENEELKLDYVALDPEVVSPDVLPSDSVVADYYEENQKEYFLGQTRIVDYVSWDVEKLSSEIEITDEEIKEYYEDSKGRYMTAPPQVKARHILIRVDRDAPENDIAAAKAKAQEIAEQARQEGADFAELARENSEGPSAEAGGDLGWFTKQEYAQMFGMQAMVPEFEETAFALEEGEVSDPVQTSFGWHVIKTEERNEGEYMPLEEAEEEIRETLRITKSLDIGREKAREFLELVEGDMNFEEAAEELGKEVKTTNWFQLSDDKVFGMDDSEVIKDGAFRLDLNEISDPLLGESHAYVIKVTEIKDEREASLEEVRERIVDRLAPEARIEATMEKAAEMLSELRAGDKTLEQISEMDGATYGETEFIERSQVSITGLGFSDTLETEVARINDDNPWPDNPVRLSGQAVIIHLIDSEPADMEAFEDEKTTFRRSVLMQKQQEVIEQWLQDLEKGKVTYTERWNEISGR